MSKQSEAILEEHIVQLLFMLAEKVYWTLWSFRLSLFLDYKFRKIKEMGLQITSDLATISTFKEHI
jgi:hypothetical protein